MNHRCTNYRPGHAVHWIQAGLTRKKPGEIKQIWVLGREEHWLLFGMDGDVHRVWNHDPEKIRLFHDAALRLQATENIVDRPLLFTSVSLLRIPDNTTPDLYPSWDGPSECTYRQDVHLNR